MCMEKKIQLLRYLYGEAEDSAELRKLLQDPEIMEEYQTLSEAKFWLDHVKRERPDPHVLDQIREAAAQGGVVAPSRPSRRDRAPLARRRIVRTPVFRYASTVLVLFIAVAIGYWQINPADLATKAEESEQSFADRSRAIGRDNETVAASEARKAKDDIFLADEPPAAVSSRAPAEERESALASLFKPLPKITSFNTSISSSKSFNPMSRK